MKKVLILLCTTAFLISANAQKSSWGIRGGIDISYLGGDFNRMMEAQGGATSNAKPGFRIGVIYDCGITPNFYIQPGLYYAMKGVKMHNIFTEENIRFKDEAKYTLSYIELPVLASIRTKAG